MIFISYSWSNRSAIEKIEKYFSLVGLDYWIDYKYLDLDLSLRPQINMALFNTKYIIHMRSNESLASKWVRYELNTANHLGINTITIDVNNIERMPNNAMHPTLQSLPLLTLG